MLDPLQKFDKLAANTNEGKKYSMNETSVPYCSNPYRNVKTSADLRLRLKDILIISAE